ncbi:endonuclease [Pseudalgibacter alginicilyticus]|uniref:Endonuclease n=1 Tax=Pseudalgibacter alginicilyticus TaxID=1736674 RepID=A0A0P0DE87_9FLAO|nr:sugar phosphate isomerase/epimerase family protein [Pseudalgibacter alginicilyticus]ALJ06348.1 endonuclease [Pseudalgibacter alginicilyticus]
MRKEISRRQFIEKSTLALGAAITAPAFSQPLFEKSKLMNDLEIHIFSKHLQFLNYNNMAEAAAEIGFAGVDLSVRNKGHVLPERVKDDLPKAIEAIKKVGFQPKLMTSGILSADEKYTNDVLETASKMGVEYYRLGYYKYSENKSIAETISNVSEQLKTLVILNKKHGIKGAFQNHAGLQVGASIWEIHELLKNIKSSFIGCQYDIRHATVEGGKSWQTGLKLIRPKINSLVLKDFKWIMKHDKWDVLNVPIGEGMVDFKAYFKLLKAYQIHVPISLHCEYDLGGAEHGSSTVSIPQKDVFSAMKKDLNTIRRLWNEVE